MKKRTSIKIKISIIILFVMIIQIVSPVAISFISINSYAVESSTENDDKYTELYDKLCEVIEQKNWDDDIKEVFIEGMKSLYDSYDNIYNSYSILGYPEKEKYIEDNYINPLKGLYKVYILSDEEMERTGHNYAAYVTYDDNGRLEMYLKNIPSEETELKSYINTLQHEVRHLMQEGHYYDNNTFFLSHAITEGWAVLGELNSYRENTGEDITEYWKRINGDGKNDSLQDGNYLLVGGKGSTTEYAWLSNMMLKLMIIVGYDDMLKMERNEISISDMVDRIYQNLGEEQADRFIDDIKTSSLNYSWDSIGNMEAFYFNDDADVNKVIDTENMVLNVLKNKISKADSKEEIQSYFNFYYIYKKYYCIKYQEVQYIDNGMYVTDKSNEKFMIDEIESVLIDKAIEHNVITKISDNDEMNRIAIKALLSYRTGGNSSAYTGAINLEDECFTYDETDETGTLTGKLVIKGLELEFDVNGNISCNYIFQPDDVDSTNQIMNFEKEKFIEEISVLNAPSKTTYIQNKEELDLTGGILQVVYNDESKDTISLTNENVKVTGFDNTRIGKEELTVEYEGKKTSFSVEIISKQITGITIKANPTKTTYIQNNEKLDLTGGTIEVIYNDSSKDTVSLTNENVKVTGFDNTKIGKEELTVEYEGKKTSFNVEIISKQITGITIKANPTKTTYIQNNEKLDLTGGIIEITYNDSSKDTVSLTNENVKVTGFDNTKIGKEELTVEYGGKKTSFKVEIVVKSSEENSNKDKDERKVSTEKDNVEKTQDTSASNRAFGQYGGKTVVLTIISIALMVCILIYRRLKKVKFIK